MEISLILEPSFWVGDVDWPAPALPITPSFHVVVPVDDRGRPRLAPPSALASKSSSVQTPAMEIVHRGLAFRSIGWEENG